MNKEIKYNGLTAMPSEYDSPDGDLGAMINLVPEDNGLKPTGNFKPVFLIENGSHVSYIHTTGKYKHYICIEKSENIYGERPWGKGTLVYWLDNMVNGKTMEEIYEEDGEPASFNDFVSADIAAWAADQAHTEPHPNQIYVFPQGTEIYAIKGIGNVLLMMTSDGMHYSLWSDEDERYNYLGDHIPELPINFGLVGHFTHMPADKDNAKGRAYPYEVVLDLRVESILDQIWDNMFVQRARVEYEEAQRLINQTILGKTNKFIQEASVNQGRFLFPFLVRYGLRLYDGELTMLSSPVLMNTGDDPLQCVINGYDHSAQHWMSFQFTMVGMCHDLDFQVMGDNTLETMLKWKDIVKSVDIFISKPFYTYDQNGEIEYPFKREEMESTGYYCKGGDLYYPEQELTRYDVGTFNYTSNSIQEAYEAAFAPLRKYTESDLYNANGHAKSKDGQKCWMGKCLLPKRNIASDISDCADFYLLKSIPIEDLTNNRTQIVVKKDFLQSLVNRESLKDDYDSHDKLIPKYVFDYNARLNITDIKKVLYDQFNIKSALIYQGQYVGDYDYTDPEEGTLANSSGNTSSSSGGTWGGESSSGDDATNEEDDTSGHTSGTGTFGGRVTRYQQIADLTVEDLDWPTEDDTVTLVGEDGETTIVEPALFTDDEKEEIVAGLNAVAMTQATRATNIKQIGCVVVVKQDYKEFAIRLPDVEMVADFPVQYIYYPNPNAKKIIIGEIIETPSNGTAIKGREYKMGTHDFLSGSLHSIKMLGTENIVERMFYLKDYAFDQAHVVDLENKIYTSEANNPFLFPLTGINTVGTGHIIGMASATKALSQGQYGQFPLYAFSTEGVWSLEVSSTGSYSSKHPLSRDVCTNAAGITQTDDAVLFPTDRGIMLLQGSNTIPISDVLNSRYPFDEGVKGDIEKLPKITEILQSEGISAETLNHERWLDYLKGCQIAYDYTNQRIIVYNTSKDYAYIYCLQTKMWGMIACKVRQPQPINSYPDALLQVLTEQKGYRIDNFSKETLKPSKVFYITRTLKLDAADVLKTIDTVIQRGMFRRGAVKSVLYGSRDLHHWHLVSSSTTHEMRRFSGTPYKYFRILVMGELQADENISGCTINYTPKHTNKIR